MIVLKTKNEKYFIDFNKFVSIYKITITFHSEERLVNLERGRECFVGLSHRRKMYTEEKAKVVASVWGTEFIQFHSAQQI